MKRIILLVAMLAGPALADDMVLKGPMGEYRLTQAERKVAAALAAIKPGHEDRQRAGTLTTDSGVIRFCWLVDGDTVFAMDEAGRLHVGPAAAFRRASGI